MKPFGRTQSLAIVVLCIFVVAAFLTVCDRTPEKPDDSQKTEAHRQEELQARLHADEVQRRELEKSLQTAEASRNVWVVGLSIGACFCSLVAMLIGVHIGSRARDRSQKESPHG